MCCSKITLLQVTPPHKSACEFSKSQSWTWFAGKFLNPSIIPKCVLASTTWCIKVSLATTVKHSGSACHTDMAQYRHQMRFKSRELMHALVREFLISQFPELTKQPTPLVLPAFNSISWINTTVTSFICHYRHFFVCTKAPCRAPWQVESFLLTTWHLNSGKIAQIWLFARSGTPENRI